MKSSKLENVPLVEENSIFFPEHGDLNTLKRFFSRNFVDVPKDRQSLVIELLKDSNYGMPVLSQQQRRYKNNSGFEKLVLESIKSGEIGVRYQPKVSILDGSLIGVEALIDWRIKTSDGEERIPPEAFVKEASKTNLILHLGEHVNEIVVNDLAYLQDNGLQTKVSINCIPKQFSKVNRREADVYGTLTESLTNLCAQKQVHLSNLEIELLETDPWSENPSAIEELRKLHEKGLTVSIDDYGKGFNNLSTLKKIDFISYLKIDKDDLPPRELSLDDESKIEDEVRNNLELIKAVSDIYGLEVIVEGVETMLQYQVVNIQGFQHVQGYGISEPVSKEQLADYIRDPNLLKNRIGKLPEHPYY